MTDSHGMMFLHLLPMMVIDMQGVVMEASHASGLIKSGVQGNTAAFAHFDFAPPLVLFCARESPCRHRPGGRLCLPVLAAKATQLCPGFSALRRVECHASEYSGTLSVVTALVVFVGLSESQAKRSCWQTAQQGGVLA